MQVNNRSATVVVVATIILALLAVAVIQSLSFHIFGTCFGEDHKQYESPGGEATISVRQKKCPTASSTTTVNIKLTGAQKKDAELFSVPSLVRISPQVMRQASIVVDWRGEDEVWIIYAEPLKSLIFEQLSSFRSNDQETLLIGDVELRFIPYAP